MGPHGHQGRGGRGRARRGYSIAGARLPGLLAHESSGQGCERLDQEFGCHVCCRKGAVTGAGDRGCGVQKPRLIGCDV